ncbi:MAG: hypothetical protein J6S63_07690 [Atopobiaceae bacterium]|nr:hypothetical protein [Atopobiaceae bacterium]
MAHKMNITQEVEDALRKANIPEEGIAKLREAEVDDDVEKLDLDGLDGVSGGFTFGAKDEESFYQTAMLFSKTFGLDLSINMMANMYNLNLDFLKELRRHYDNDDAAHFWNDVRLMIYHGKTIYH